jgi:broad-specificity NMP kinase
MIKREIICLLGNDGCGKSSICQLINSKNNINNDTIIGIERSNGLGAEFGIDPSIIDKLTLEYVFDEENFNQIKLPDQTINEENIYWIILDCEVDTILKRIQTRTTKNIWETRKALNYFQQRFRHLSGHFGIPFIDTTQRTLQQVYYDVIDVVRKYSNYYQYYRQIGTQRLNYHLIEQYDIENKLYSIINTYHFDKITNLPEYAHEFDNIDKRKFYIRWFINNNSFEIDQEKNILKIGDYQLSIKETIFKLIIEGESKKVYQDISGNPFTKDLAIIVLKSTIYSHSMQATGEINNLGKIFIFKLFLFSKNI